MSWSKASIVVSSISWLVFFPTAITTWMMFVPLKLFLEKDFLLSPYRILFAILVPFLASVRSVKKNSLDFFGAVVALITGFVLTMSNYGFMAMLLAFYYSSTKLTKFRQHIKSSQDAESEKKPRSASNVICNSLPALICAMFYMMESGCCETAVDLSPTSLTFTSSWFSVAVLGSVSSVCADTWASEIGSSMRRETTRLITSGKNVPPGTNGGVTVIGLLSSCLGGCFIGLVFALTLKLFAAEHIFQASLMIVGTVCGLIGSIVDSIMGATLQYSGYDLDLKKVVASPFDGKNVKHISGVDILNNHHVNLFSSMFTTLVAPFVYYYLQNYEVF